LGTNGSGTDQFTNSSTITAASVADAIRTNASNRAGLGAQLNALNYAIDNLQTLSNNLNDAYSRISDVDYASETSILTKNQIMQEAAIAMLAQAKSGKLPASAHHIPRIQLEPADHVIERRINRRRQFTSPRNRAPTSTGGGCVSRRCCHS
jgi:hypothetical protein